MANTYTQINIHLVFATKGRYPQLMKLHRKQIFAYLVSKAKENDCYVKAIGGTEDHLHLLISLNPKHGLSELVKVLKGATSHYINELRLSGHHFDWQAGYGAFSVSQSNLEQVIDYINNQDEHHHGVTFQEEYISLLEKHNIEFDSQYVFEQN